MNGKQLKNSVLQWAVQGKLVPQDPHGESASVLLEKIRQEKKRLTKEKKIKRDKNASIIYHGDDNSYYEETLATGEVRCIDNEIPFEIPQGQEWCRIQDVITFVSGQAYRRGELLSRGKYKVLRADNFFTDNQWYYSDLELSKDKYCYHGDLLYAWSASFGPQIWNSGKTIFRYHIWNVKFGTKVLFREYLYYFSLFNKTQIRASATGDTMVYASMENMKPRLISILPINEQKRVVCGIERVLPYVEKYELSRSKKDILDANIRESLKEPILQEAIQGKPVPQIVRKGTAHELLEQIKAKKLNLVKKSKLKKTVLSDSAIFRGDDNKYYERIGRSVQCTAGEIPLEIPVDWAWVRLDDICSFTRRGKSPKYSLVRKYPVVAQKCNQWLGFSLEKAKSIEPQNISSYKEEYILQGEDLMWDSTELGTLGRVTIYYKKPNPYKLTVADSHVTVIRSYKQHVVSEYPYYYFTGDTVQSVVGDRSDGSTKQKELSAKTTKNCLVPLLPTEEQKRIVERIRELMQLLK